MRIAQALQWARDRGIARLDAQLVLAHHLNRERVWLLAHDDDELEPTAWAAVEADLHRRAAGVPLAYLTGRREFAGLVLHVDSTVLVPRPETEILVDWAVELLQANRERWPEPQVADLGTGSGAIGLAVKHRCPWATVTASDASPQALATARANAARLKLELRFALGPWWQALEGQQFHVAISNPPYVAAQDPHLRALWHEPRDALTPEGDGLAALADIIAGAAPHLYAAGWLLLEHGNEQASPVGRLLAARGFADIATRDDLAGWPRCTGAHR